MESVPDPMDEIVINFILSQKRETAELDFKLTLDIRKDSDFANIAKDIFAMSNYGGGYILFGFRETKTGTFEPEGLPSDFHIDQATLQEKFNAYVSDPLSIGYAEIEREVDGQKKKFAVLYVPSSTIVLKPVKYGVYDDPTGKVKRAFSKDEVLFRRGTQSIHATQKEIKFIEQRASETQYRIGLLSGKPDDVKENLYGNFFEITKMPASIYEAELPRNIHFSFFETKETPFIRQGERIYSFCDLSQEPFGKYITAGTLQKHELASFLEMQDKRILLTWLLNSEVRSAAIKKGLRHDHWNKNVYFYPTNEHERYETWKSRFKKSGRLVAKEIYITQLRRSLFVHPAALILISLVGTKFYLKILPEIILTYDGYETIQGVREGPVKTRLSYNQYNDTYLNLVLFWISRFKSLDEKSVDINGRIFASSEPVTVTLDVGLRSDRPSEEFSRREDELYSFEAVEIA